MLSTLLILTSNYRPNSFLYHLQSYNLVNGAPFENSDDNGDEATMFGDEPKSKMLSAAEILYGDEGQTVILPCKIENKGELVVLWYKNGDLLYSDDRLLNLKVDKNDYEIRNDSLIIKRLTYDTVGNYTCTNSEVAVNHTVGIKVTIDISVTKNVFEKGDTIELKCTATGYPVPTLTWSKQTSSGAVEISKDSTVIIRNAGIEDSGTYMCIATNPHTSLHAEERVSVTVGKGVAPENSVVNAAENDENSKLCCNFDKMKKIDWYKNGKEIRIDNRFSIEPSKHRQCLVIHKVKEEDIGVYVCQISKLNSDIPEKASVNLTGVPSTPILESVSNAQFEWFVKSYAPIERYQIFVKKQEENDWKIQFDKIVENNDKELMLKETFSQVPSGRYDVKLIVWNKFGSSELISYGPLVSDNTNIGVIGISEQINSSAGSSFRIPFVCIILTILVRLWTDC